MYSLPEPISALIAALNKLPGIGPRSAERIALHLAQTQTEPVRQLAQAILTARERIASCHVCGGLTEVQPCVLCADPRRDGSIICLVEQPVDIISIEKSGTFHGKYNDPTTGTPLQFGGVAFQKRNVANGSLFGASESSRVLLAQ